MNLQPLPLAQPSGLRPLVAELHGDRAADAAVTGFAIAHLGVGARVLWVQDRLSRREGGRPYVSGLGVAVEMLLLQVGQARDALWAMEQALTCRDLRAVVGEIWGDPRALDFAATKRLALRAEASGVQAWLIRRTASPNLSAARERWRIASLPSLAHPDDAQAPGEALWRATLFRSRTAQVGDWKARPGPPGEGPIIAPWVAGDDAGGIAHQPPASSEVA